MFERTFSFWRRLIGRHAKAEVASAPPSDERCVWVRYPADLETTYRPATTSHETCAARVRNVSRGGASLLLHRKFETGELLSIELPRRGDEPTHTVLACIVRVQEESAGEWAVGC